MQTRKWTIKDALYDEEPYKKLRTATADGRILIRPLLQQPMLSHYHHHHHHHDATGAPDGSTTTEGGAMRFPQRKVRCETVMVPRRKKLAAMTIMDLGHHFANMRDQTDRVLLATAVEEEEEEHIAIEMTEATTETATTVIAVATAMTVRMWTIERQTCAHWNWPALSTCTAWRLF